MLKVSVVIPTLNRADLLATTIDRIESQTFPRDNYEVLVIDNASNDDTRRVLAQKSLLYANLRTFRQTKRGAAATRNVGIQNATGDVVLFIDDDIEADENLIQAHVTYHERDARVSAIGAVVTPWASSADPFLRYLCHRGIVNPYSLTASPMDFSYYHTGNVSSPRALLQAVNGFNEEFSIYGMEDIELGYRLEKAGSRMVPAPDAKGVHRFFPTYPQFIQRCEHAGYSLGKLVDLHPELKPRFVENGKRTRLLKRFHRLYQMFSDTTRPVSNWLIRYEERRGTGPVMPILDQHFYWSVRYHFFLGYSHYLKHARNGNGQEADALPRLHDERLPKLMVEPRSKV